MTGGVNALRTDGEGRWWFGVEGAWHRIKGVTRMEDEGKVALDLEDVKGLVVVDVKGPLLLEELTDDDKEE